MTTKRILAYRNTLYRVPEGPDWDSDNFGTRLHKQDPKWQETMCTIKEVLAGREDLSDSARR